MQRVGVRQLRQNLSVYLRRVKEGEALEVTEHGRVVAILAPAPAGTTGLERMLAEGRIRPAVGSIADLPPPLGPGGTRGTDALAAEREAKQ
jgi:prevent-host-death family protein